MILDKTFVGSTAMLCGCRVREMPFNKGRAGYQRDIVEVNDFELQLKARLLGH